MEVTVSDAAPLTIISVSAEVAPWSKVGGLADVAAALPVALARRGHRVIGVAPRYAPYDIAWDTRRTARFGLFGAEHEVRCFHARIDGVDRVFIGHPALSRGGIYGDEHGVYGDNDLRFALLSRAAIEAVALLGLSLPDDGADTIVLAHDWHAALATVYLAARYRHHGRLVRARSLLAIHNLAHQGVFSRDRFAGLDLEEHWWPTLDMGGDVNFLKAGIMAADRLVTVSPTYAAEIRRPEHGWGLDGLLRMRAPVLDGIRNGLDTEAWNPRTDPYLPAHYDLDDLSGKAACKAALQRELSLAEDPTVPLVVFIGRLDAQKGVDLLLSAVPWLRREGAQLVVLGTGDPGLEQRLREVGDDRIRPIIDFSSALAHRLTAAADVQVVPSRFEPCGLTQLQAMRYGAVPVVAATGGLVDTVQPYDPIADQGTGWHFRAGDADDLVRALGDALYTFRQWPEAFRGLVRRGMARDWSWAEPAAAWEARMRDALAVPPWA
ncbi:MAG: glycogen synthase [Deltaproteobacteria bacterium]|nr:MAG: glycogen synthase [Deltaproteobacteria bacterium]